MKLVKQHGKKAILIGVSAALLVGGFWIIASRTKTPTVRLPNGSELCLLAVTQGSNNVFFPGGIWDRLIHRFVPTKGLQIGSFKIDPVSPVIDQWRYADGRPAYLNRVVLWLGHRGPTNTPAPPVAQERWFANARATLAAESGEEWEMRPGTAIVRATSVGEFRAISTWDFTSFPRRGKKLRFRIYTRNEVGGWDRLADFKLRNPAPGRYPRWTPTALPATQAKGDLEVSLRNLIVGDTAGGNLHGGGSPFTQAIFAVTQNGQATEAWLPDRIDASDATGNEPWFSKVDYGTTNGLVYYNAQGTSLSSDEVWRLRVRFAKEKAPAAAAKWASPPLAVKSGNVLPAKLTNTFLSGQLTLECSQRPFRNTIRLNLAPLPENTRVGQIEIIDNDGRKAPYASGFVGDHGFDAQWGIPSDAESVKVTIGLVETRSLEFVAQPKRDAL